MAFCPNCGKKLIEGAVFCGACGTNVSEYISPPPIEEGPVYQPEIPTVDVPGMQTFDPPAAPVADEPEVPTFQVPGMDPFVPPAPPTAAGAEIPTFDPPAAAGTDEPELPSIDVPGLQGFDSPQKQNPDVPIFSPPMAPTFEPPSAPVFTPPVRTHYGPSCYYHQDEPAVTSCARCGKPLCQDCLDSYGVSSGEYAGRALCYDCTRELVAENVEILSANKSKIKAQFIVSLVGIVLGFIFGVSSGGEGAFLAGLVFAAVGGVFLSAMKVFFSLVWEAIKIAFSGNFGLLTVFSLAFHILVLIVKCFITTISNTFYYITYLKQTSGFIESDQNCLRQMQDYMEYTLVRNQNRGVDIETLLKENSQLANNSVAQMARTQTEEQIEASMRNCVATINENGEIIRSFREAA